MRTIQIDTSLLNHRRDLDSLLNGLMGFPHWHTSRLNDWIDLVAVSHNPDAPVRFRSQEAEVFNLQLLNSLDFHLRAPVVSRMLFEKITAVNARAKQKIGRPLLTLTLM